MIKTMTLTIVALILMVSTGCGPTGPDIPPPPTGLTVTAASPITLSWNSVADVTGYNVYRGPVSGGITAKTLLASNVAVTNFADATATVVGTTYYYQVTAVNILGESGGSNEVTAVVQ